LNKEQLIETVKQLGDATITYISRDSGKFKYNVCTLDFTTPYIMTKQNRAKETDDTLLMFCWDVDAYRLLNTDSVVSVAKVL
jgi:hypothetical protein